MTKESFKKLSGIYKGSPFHFVGDGFRVSNYFPNGNQFGKRISPFFLLDYNPPHRFEPSDKPRGVGVHPHRGFETVTIAFEGSVAHHDSYGNSGIIGPGDVQWMTAASGVLHKEYHEKKFAAEGGTFHMLQLWVNLPSKNKMSKPKYQPLTRDMMGKFVLPDKKGMVTIVAGEYNGIKGPASTFSPINLFTVDLKPSGKFDASFPPAYNTGILFTKGTVKINGNYIAKAADFALFENEGELVSLEAMEDAAFVVFNGEPIDEPVAHYGPFVMNSMDEIRQAFEDYQQGKFGVLEE